MPPLSCSVRALAVGLLVLAACAPAVGQDVGGFYRGKTITLIVGGSAGSDDDIYARLVARYLGRHIAGSPAVAVSDMPGNGGHAAAAQIYSAVAKDGTVIGTVPPAVITAPLWFGVGQIAHDPTQFIYLASAASESTDCFVRSDSPVKNFRDAFVGEVMMGAATDGGPTRDGPALLNAMLGTKFRTVSSYADTGAIFVAIEKGEVAGACGLTWSSVTTRHPDWLLKGVLRGLVQESVTGSPLATRLGIPLAVNFAGSAADREVLALAYTQQQFGRPFILPPAAPPERVAALRKAFLDTLQDQELLADAKRASLQITPLPGERVEALVAKLYDTPPQIVDRVRAALGGTH